MTLDADNDDDDDEVYKVDFHSQGMIISKSEGAGRTRSSGAFFTTQVSHFTCVVCEAELHPRVT